MRVDAISHSDTRKCRLCFEDKKGLIYIFEVSGSLKNVARAISEVLLYEVSLDDQFPPFVCTDCSDKLHEFKEFKKRCDAFNETYKFFLKAKEGTKSICTDVKEEGIPVLLKERHACSLVVHPGKEFKVARENPVKAVKDEDEVPIGDNDFIVRAFPIRADDDLGVQDNPLAVPQSEVSSDDVACVLPNNDKAVIERGKQEAKEEEIDVPYDGLPFIVRAFPIVADQSVDEEKRQVADPIDVPLVSEVSSVGVACVPPKEDKAVIQRGKQEAEEDEIDVPDDDYPVTRSSPPQESDSDDDVIAEYDVVTVKDVIAEDLEQGDQNQPLPKEEGRKLRPRKATNYRLDCPSPRLEHDLSDSSSSNYSLSDQEDGSSSSSEASYRRNDRVRKKCNVDEEGMVKSGRSEDGLASNLTTAPRVKSGDPGRSEDSLRSNRFIIPLPIAPLQDEQWLHKTKLHLQGMAGSVTKKCRREELGNSKVVQRQNVVGARSDSGRSVPVGKDAVTLLFLAQDNVSSRVAMSLNEPNKAVVPANNSVVFIPVSAVPDRGRGFGKQTGPSTSVLYKFFVHNGNSTAKDAAQATVTLGDDLQKEGRGSVTAVGAQSQLCRSKICGSSRSILKNSHASSSETIPEADDLLSGSRQEGVSSMEKGSASVLRVSTRSSVQTNPQQSDGCTLVQVDSNVDHMNSSGADGTLAKDKKGCEKEAESVTMDNELNTSEVSSDLRVSAGSVAKEKVGESIEATNVDGSRWKESIKEDRGSLSAVGSHAGLKSSGCSILKNSHGCRSGTIPEAEGQEGVSRLASTEKGSAMILRVSTRSNLQKKYHFYPVQRDSGTVVQVDSNVDRMNLSGADGTSEKDKKGCKEEADSVTIGLKTSEVACEGSMDFRVSAGLEKVVVGSIEAADDVPNVSASGQKEGEPSRQPAVSSAFDNSDWDWSESEQSDNNFEASEFFVQDFEVDKRQESLSKTEYLCEICGKVLRTNSSLYSHKKNHSGELLFACEKCPKTFLSSVHLQTHMLAHGNDRKFKCDKCPKAFKCKMHLQQHGISHTGKRRYPCEHCEDSFRTRWQFKSHQKKHEGKVVWACDCGEKCKSWEELEKHHEEHKKNRTFKCGVCSKVFNRKVALSRHMSIHTKPFRCSICDKGFSKKRDRLDHEDTHTGERKFECKQCGVKFYRRRGMMNHFRLIHIETQKFKCRFCKFRTKKKYEWKKHENRHREKDRENCQSPDSTEL